MNSSAFLNLVFLSLSLLIFTNGVFGDETENVLVKEGDHVTLHTGVEKQKEDLIVWSFGPENILVAKVNGKADSSRVYGSVIGRGMLDSQSGSLTITNTRTTDSGLYNLKISSKNKVSYKTFSVAVYGSETLKDSTSNQIDDLDNEPCQTSSCFRTTHLPMFWMVATPVVVCLILICLILVVVCYRKHTGGYQKAPLKKTGHPENPEPV